MSPATACTLDRCWSHAVSVECRTGSRLARWARCGRGRAGVMMHSTRGEHLQYTVPAPGTPAPCSGTVSRANQLTAGSALTVWPCAVVMASFKLQTKRETTFLNIHGPYAQTQRAYSISITTRESEVSTFVFGFGADRAWWEMMVHTPCCITRGVCPEGP